MEIKKLGSVSWFVYRTVEKRTIDCKPIRSLTNELLIDSNLDVDVIVYLVGNPKDPRLSGTSFDVSSALRYIFLGEAWNVLDLDFYIEHVRVGSHIEMLIVDLCCWGCVE